ncbi:MAG: serine/threonine-protein kinase [bacterium]
MTFVGDRVLTHLRDVADRPDLSGTKYELVRRLDRGGMGTVYLVRDTQLDRDVALKVLSAEDPSGALAERMVREARHIARLEHPNIVPLHDTGRLPDGRVFYVMKLVRGKRLDEWRRENPSLPAALRLFLKVCEATAFAHSHGVIHRDLKPQNVMVGEFGEALVMDWGLAKALRHETPAAGGVEEASHASPARSGFGPAADSARGARDTTLPLAPGAHLATTAHGDVVGTPAYMAPEQARGEIALIDERTDVYSLGAILRFLIAGRSASDSGESGSASLAGAPKPLASICAMAMAADREARYASVRALAADIDRYLGEQPVAAHRESVLERANRLLGRHRTIVILIAAYLVMRLVVLLTLGR